MFLAIAEINVSDDASMEQFKENLLAGFRERFSAHGFSTAEAEDDVSQLTRLKRITRCEIFGDKRLIAATVLDPRFKTSSFAGLSFSS